MTSCSPDPNAGELDPKAGVAEPKGAGVLAAPKAGVLAAPNPPPKALGCAVPNPVLVAPKVGVLGCAPKAGVDAAPKRGCITIKSCHESGDWKLQSSRYNLLHRVATAAADAREKCFHTWEAAPNGLGLPKEVEGVAWPERYES